MEDNSSQEDFILGTMLPLDQSVGLRDWWHQLLRSHGRYSCYGIFLVLPGDDEGLKYLLNYGKELEILSGTNMLLIALTKSYFKRIGEDDVIWKAAINDQTGEGYSSNIAKIFEISFTSFPCLIIFKDIRSIEHVVVSLKNLNSESIAEQMRMIFSIIDNAINEKKDPLSALSNYQAKETRRLQLKAVVSELNKQVGKTYEVAITAWIKSMIGNH